jgi:hypothetical protein
MPLMKDVHVSPDSISKYANGRVAEAVRDLHSASTVARGACAPSGWALPQAASSYVPRIDATLEQFGDHVRTLHAMTQIFQQRLLETADLYRTTEQANADLANGFISELAEED